MSKKILITGGTGFLGRNLAKKLKAQGYEVVIAGRNNTQNMFAQMETGCEAMPLDVANMESVRDVFHRVRPAIVIHAAATKFVDLSEKYPFEAVDINVLGSENVARAAIDFGVETVVGISTDKAAQTSANTYALTKALMERLFCTLNGTTATKFTCVRFGNIAWSSGSVLPIWKKMMATNGLIESTGPDMRRFFFSVDEASEVVITALHQIAATQGNILTRLMKAVLVRDMLETWIKHKGGSWKQIAARPGDKPDEYLFSESEIPYTSEWLLNGVKYFLISPNKKAEKPVDAVISSLNAEFLDEQEILHLLNHAPNDK